MTAEVLQVDPRSPEPEIMQRAAQKLLDGDAVAFPTETVYGLGAIATDRQAVERIYEIKGRPSRNPLIVHIEGENEAEPLTASWSESARQLARAFWPGPLTIVAQKSPLIPDATTAGGATVALRVPSHPVARALIAAVGKPLAAPSANRSGALSPTTAEHVLKSLGDRISLILDGGPCISGLESTVVDTTGEKVKLLRPGPISVAALQRVVGAIDLPGNLVTDGTLPSPGLLTRHYAPRTALECAETPEELESLRRLYETAGLRVAVWQLSSDPVACAARFYSDLHALDDGRFDRLLVLFPPEEDEWRALRDRLRRAAAEE